MADLNVVTLTGRVTKDATIESVGAKGTRLTKFGLANNTGFGQYEKTNFFNVQIWGKQGEAVAQYIVKGKQVGVTGTLECQKWTAYDGTPKESWNLTCTGVTLLADAKNQQQRQVPEYQSTVPDATTDALPTF